MPDTRSGHCCGRHARAGSKNSSWRRALGRHPRRAPAALRHDPRLGRTNHFRRAARPVPASVLTHPPRGHHRPEGCPRPDTTSIGRELHLARYSIQDHPKAIFSKTGVDTRRDLVPPLRATRSAASSPTPLGRRTHMPQNGRTSGPWNMGWFRTGRRRGVVASAPTCSA